MYNSCFSTATMVARTLLNIRFIRTLPVLFLVHFVLSRSVAVWFQTIPVVPIVIGITIAFTFHLRLISVVRPLYFRIFSAFLITSLSPEIATYIYIHVPFLLSRIMMPNLLVESFCLLLLIQNIVTLLHLSCFKKK